MGTVSEEYSVKKQEQNLAQCIWVIHISPILSLQLLEGGFNGYNIFWYFEKELEIYDMAWRENIILDAENWLINKNAAEKKFYMKIWFDVLCGQAIQ